MFSASLEVAVVNISCDGHTVGHDVSEAQQTTWKNCSNVFLIRPHWFSVAAWI